MPKKPQNRGGRSSKLVEAVVALKRNTTWKCGRLERLILDYLSRQLRFCGRRKVPLREMIRHFGLKGKKRSEFIDAVRRLERRNIITLEV